MPAKVSEDEFIRLWLELGGASGVARTIGCTVANAYSRRRRIEASRGIVLVSEAVKEIREQKFIEMDVDQAIIAVSSDLHCWPGALTTAQKAFLATIKYMGPQIVVLNGDVFDGAKLSRFGSSEFNKMPTVAEELRACVEYLWKIQQVAAKGTRFIWVMGNHDQRFVRKLVDGAGEYEGIPGFDIRDHFPNWEMCYRFTVNPGKDGMTDFVHNWAGGIHAAYNNVLRAGCNYVTGHTHRLMDRPWSDRTGRRYGIETGTLTEIDGPQAYYVAGRPVDWGAGFPVLTFKEGRLLRPEYVDVIGKDKISFRSQVVSV